MYLCQKRNQERPAEERRPLGCRTAVGGGGSCEGAAPSAHCLTADIKARWLMTRRSSAVYGHIKTLHHRTWRLIFRQITLRCLMYRREECTDQPQEILYISFSSHKPERLRWKQAIDFVKRAHTINFKLYVDDAKSLHLWVHAFLHRLI